MTYVPPLNWLTSIYLWRHLFTTYTTHQWRQIDMHSETIAWRANETFPWLPWWVTKEMTKIFRNYWSSPLYLRPRVVKMRSACAPSGPAEPERSFRFASKSVLKPLFIAICARYRNMFSNRTITRFESSEISHFISGGAHTTVPRYRPDKRRNEGTMNIFTCRLMIWFHCFRIFAKVSLFNFSILDYFYKHISYSSHIILLL